MHHTFCVINLVKRLQLHLFSFSQNLQDLVNQQYRAHSAILTSDSVQLLNLIETEYRVSVLYVLF